MSLGDYEACIGLEVHVQLNTKSKMFCSCRVNYGDSPNVNVCPVCLGFPGSLPVLNKLAIEKTILTGLMLNCKISKKTKWDRKSYFYPDMPKNYQISQYDFPICLGGNVPLYELSYPKDSQKNIVNPNKSVMLTRIHLEEDVGKSSHLDLNTSIDFNRAGTPLMEIVTEPDITNAEEAVAFLNSLRQILNYGEVSSADMEKGQLRCDVNISVKKKEDKKLGEKIELKNLNSVSAVRRSIKFEINRQIKELENGNKLVQSTRRWNDDLGETHLMRTKEDAHDYRYLPDPDLPLVETQDMVEVINKAKPELPHEKLIKYKEKYALSSLVSGIISANKDLSIYFEDGVELAKDKKKYANWICNNLMSLLNTNKIYINNSPISAKNIAELVNIIDSGDIDSNTAKEIVLPEMFASNKSALIIIKEKKLIKEKIDSNLLKDLIEKIISDNPKIVTDIKNGNKKASGSIVGEAMKATKGKANPKEISEMINNLLS